MFSESGINGGDGSGRLALVTGCAGFIGSHLSEALLSQGWSVRGIDCFTDYYAPEQKARNLSASTDFAAFEFKRVDLSTDDLAAAIDGVDVVFNLAAEPGVRSSWGADFGAYLRNNIEATQRLLEATAALDHPIRIVHSSSSSVYGEPDLTPTPETARMKPISPYGVTKGAAEHLCDVYARQYGLDIVMLRYFTVYGPRQRPDMAFSRFIGAMRRRREIRVFGDGTQVRDFTFVADISAANVLAATGTPTTRVINIGGGTTHELREAIDMIGELLDVRPRVAFTETAAGDVRRTEADSRLARTQLGFKPQRTLRSGLEAQVAWTLAAERVATPELPRPS